MESFFRRSIVVVIVVVRDDALWLFFAAMACEAGDFGFWILGEGLLKVFVDPLDQFLEFRS